MKKAKSTHIITSRDKGAQRVLVLLGVGISLLLILCSIYAVTQVPLSPAGWAMVVFFAGLLVLLLTYEDNVMPDLDLKKMPFAGVAWFFSWIFVAMLVSFLITMNLGHLIMAALFGFITLMCTSYVATPEKKWGNFKEKVKDKTTRKVSTKVKSKLKRNSKTGKKKRRIKAY